MTCCHVFHWFLAHFNEPHLHFQEPRRPNLPLELEVGGDDSSAAKTEAEEKRKSRLIA